LGTRREQENLLQFASVTRFLVLTLLTPASLHYRRHRRNYLSVPTAYVPFRGRELKPNNPQNPLSLFKPKHTCSSGSEALEDFVCDAQKGFSGF
jgi:hypothetical protein